MTLRLMTSVWAVVAAQMMAAARFSLGPAGAILPMTSLTEVPAAGQVRGIAARPATLSAARVPWLWPSEALGAGLGGAPRHRPPRSRPAVFFGVCSRAVAGTTLWTVPDLRKIR